MLPLVVFALLFGFALTRVEARRRAQAVGFFQTLADAMIVIVRWVLWAAPLGVFALAFSVCVKAGVSVLSALGWYILAECTLYLAVTLRVVLRGRVRGRPAPAAFRGGDPAGAGDRR